MKTGDWKQLTQHEDKQLNSMTGIKHKETGNNNERKVQQKD